MKARRLEPGGHMAKKRATHTLWTNPMGDWTRLFDGVEITEQEVRQAVDEVKRRDRTEVEKRIRPYDTPVTNKTLSKSVG
jgi:hypothetical protein